MAPMSSPEHEGLALFDFDGTLTQGDSFLHFLLRGFSARELLRLVPGAILPSLGWGVGLLEATPAKEAITQRLFRGLAAEALLGRGREFTEHHLPRLLRPRGLERVRWHQHRGHRVVVVTASFRYWIEPWCRDHGLDLVATKLEEVAGLLTGRFDGPNCNGEEKVRRVRAAYELGTYRRIWAYGNSSGDRPMLALAHEPAYRPFT